MNVEAIFSKMSLLLLAGLFVPFILLFSLQTIYYGAYNPVLIWVYLALALSIYICMNYLLSVNMKHWFPILLVASILLGFMPYEFAIPASIELLTSSDPKLSGLSEKLPVPAGVIVDLLFYPMVYFVLYLLGKTVLNYSVQQNNP